MGTMTYFVVLPFIRNEDGDLCAVEPKEARSVEQARRFTASLAEKHGGAIAFSRTGDPQLGDWEDAEILARVGEVPADLAEYTSE